MNRQSAFAVACAVSATAALGVVASPAGAFELAPGATIFTTPVSLDNFFNPDGTSNDNAFQVDDKIFHNFFFQVACQAPGTPADPRTCDEIKNLPAVARPIGPLNPADITVSGSKNSLSPKSGPGLTFNDFWRADPGWGYDLLLGFDVHVLDPDKQITDVHLGVVLDRPLDNGTIMIGEKVTDIDTGLSLLDKGVLAVDNLSSTTDIGTEDWADLIYPVKKLRVLKDIQLLGVDDKTKVLEKATFTGLKQEFSQTVPEPGTVTGLLAIGSLSVGAMLKRHFGKKA
ncbi:hypothetical protein [Coleofasciculus sp. G2-EDA-02]|uniref:hypothetical protein n=1 Tax=Coleofasciculus sp. G2-EDA-02 TaxID=3069529 RepID=UPI0033027F03